MIRIRRSDLHVFNVQNHSQVSLVFRLLDCPTQLTLYDLDLSVVFHDKYQWEIWKNTAGKSASGLKAVWNFSENSSNVVAWPVPMAPIETLHFPTELDTMVGKHTINGPIYDLSNRFETKERLLRQFFLIFLFSCLICLLCKIINFVIRF